MYEKKWGKMEKASMVGIQMVQTKKYVLPIVYLHATL